MKRLYLIFILFILFYNVSAQSVFDNSITHIDPSLFDPYTGGQNVAAGVSASGIGRGPGILPSVGLNRYSALSWSTGGIDLNDYFEFTITPSACLNFSSFVYTGQASGTGPTSFAFRSSLDGFTSNIGTPNASGTTINLSAATYQNLSSPITFRFYAFNAGLGLGTYSINDFTFNGTTTCSTCVAPTTTITANKSTCINTATSFSVATSASSPSFTWQSSANGTTGWATVINSTPSGYTYSGINTFSLGITSSSVSTYYYRVLVASSSTCSATSATVSLTVNSVPVITSQPISATSSTASSTSFSVSATNATLYQWQQNSGSGFVNVSNGGVNPTFSGATTSVLTIANPVLSMKVYTYQCVITNSCGTVTSNGTSTLNVVNSLKCPAITGVVVNACANSTCDEGDNEMVFFNSNDYSIPVNPSNIVLKYGTTNPPTTTYSDGFTTNPTQILNLNSASGCGSLFIDAMTVGSIPPNTPFVIMRNTNCYNYDFSTFCGYGTMYVLFSTDSDWNTGGNFANSGSAGVYRYFRSDFSNVSSGCVMDYHYEPNNFTTNGTSGDGASVNFATTGAATNYFNVGCSPSPMVLPIKLLDFYAINIGNENEVNWLVSEEEDVMYYIIEKSRDAVYFEELAIVTAFNTISQKKYTTMDENPYNDITYYRLRAKNMDNTITNYEIISIDNKYNKWHYTTCQEDNKLHIDFKNQLPKECLISMHDIVGHEISSMEAKNSRSSIDISTLASGIYIIHILTPNKTESFKVVLDHDK